MAEPSERALETAGAEPQPGWYVVTHDHRVYGVQCALRTIRRMWEYDRAVHHGLPLGFVIGPRVDDLLRDAARYRWLIDHHSWVSPEKKWGEPSPGEAGIGYEWLQSKPGEFPGFDALIDAEIAREREESPK